MGGWKTWVAAGLSVAYGIGGWVTGMHHADVAMGFITAGFGMVGIGHKLEKAAAKKEE